MSETGRNSDMGLLLKQLSRQRSLSMKKLSELTGIDNATISRIIHGKRRATPEHLRKFAECLEVPVADLFVAAGYLTEQEQGNPDSDRDIYSSIDTIRNILESSNLLNKKFTIEDVKHQLADYEQFSKTEEGRKTILTGFEKKLQKVGSIGPFISHLKDMFERFRSGKGTPYQLAIMGGALIYFILPVDVIPDYIFPIGYLDDAIAVQIALYLLKKSETKFKRTDNFTRKIHF